MDIYGYFANVYDIFMESVPYKSWADYIALKFAEHGVPTGGTVVDLGCGTGTMLSLMAQKGYDMIGVDNSADMLAEAQAKIAQNSQKAMLLHQNIKNLDLYGTVDAIYSTCDVLNYFLEESELEQAIKRAAMFLNPSGVLIFDMKTAENYKQMGNAFYGDSNEGSSYIWQNNYNPDTQINKYNVRFLPKNGQPFFETHEQRAYSTSAVYDMLIKSNLKPVGIFDGYSQRDLSQNSEQVVFCALA
ncbi:MAG: methyltransferase domain-containing protein [Defluviitaleaceae bacterium]|nr:methyltransferase domain-containing protein [Defluviitaleaceae bacterium]